MVNVGRILRDYRDAGSVNNLLALWGFVDDSTFLTKAGHVGVVYRLRGVDYEGLSHPQRQALVHRFEAALRLLDEHCRVYQYLLKRTVSPFVAAQCDAPVANEAIQRRATYLNGRRQDLYDLSLYIVLLYEAPHVVRRRTELRQFSQAPREALRAWLSTDQTLQLLESELDRAIGTLHHKAQAFEVQIGEFGPARLEKADAFRFLRELLNYSPAVVDSARLAYDTHLDYFVSDSAVDCRRDHLVVGDRIVKVLSMKEPPSQTFAFLLQDLYEISGEFIACLEWQRIPSDRMRRDVQSRRRQERIRQRNVHKQPHAKSPLQGLVIVEVVATADQREQILGRLALRVGKIARRFGKRRQQSFAHAARRPDAIRPMSPRREIIVEPLVVKLAERHDVYVFPSSTAVVCRVQAAVTAQ